MRVSAAGVGISCALRHLSTTSLSASTALPSSACVVVIGGGIIGNSVAYHLAKAFGDGSDDNVLLLERAQLTSGTTWHAAGLMVTFGSMSETSTELRKYSRDLYARVLPDQTGQDTGFSACGFIELATNADRLEEYRRVAAFNRICGIDVQEIGPKDVLDLFPLARVDDVLAGFYVKDDGRVNPVDAAMALAKGARLFGAKVVEGVSVERVETRNGAVSAVITGDGHRIECDYVVNCAGMWASALAAQNGIVVPNQAAEHYYLITDKMDNVEAHWPVIEDPSNFTYIRPEGAGLLVGLFEGTGKAWAVTDGVPADFSFGEIEPDFERLSPYLEKAMSRVPTTLNTGMKKFFCGPESFTPDGGPVLGEAPELRRYFVAAGLNSIGILTGPGIGKLMAHWIINDTDEWNLDAFDVTQMNMDRFHAYHNTRAFKTARASETLGNVYKAHYPFKEPKTARGVKVSPLHALHRANHAHFRDVSAWEMPDWFGDCVDPSPGPLGWDRPSWFSHWAHEHHGCRKSVAMIDMSFMSKFLLQGTDAGRLLNRLSTANVDGPHSTLTYTQWLNSHGKLEADLTVGKMPPTPSGEQQYMVVATDTMHRHVETLIRRAIESDDLLGDRCSSVTITDVTGAFAQINLQGPNSRRLMQDISDEDLSDEAFPFRHYDYITVGNTRVLCARLTYVGELGYELYVPVEQASALYSDIVRVGASHGLVHAGLKSLGSLRMEKAYRDYGHDLDNTDSILESGLSFTIDWDKRGGFVGDVAARAERERGRVPKKRLVQVLCKDPVPMMYHNEIVLRDGVPVGYVRVASYGHTLGGAVGLAMVERPDVGLNATKKWLDSGEWTLNIAGRMYPAAVSIRPMYDPSGANIKV